MSPMLLIVPEGPTPIEVVDPSESQVLSAVRSLNGSSVTELYLQPDSGDPESYFAVAGGAEGRYVVFICHANERFVEAVTPGVSGESVELVCAGQPGRYAPSQLVTLDEALRAASHFHQTGAPADSLHWQQR